MYEVGVGLHGPASGLMQPIGSIGSEAGTECLKLRPAPDLVGLEVGADLGDDPEINAIGLGERLE